MAKLSFQRGTRQMGRGVEGVPLPESGVLLRSCSKNYMSILEVETGEAVSSRTRKGCGCHAEGAGLYPEDSWKLLKEF